MAGKNDNGTPRIRKSCENLGLDEKCKQISSIGEETNSGDERLLNSSVDEEATEEPTNIVTRETSTTTSVKQVNYL